jgi:PPP family 3-phenylpropionic acid transporter
MHAERAPRLFESMMSLPLRAPSHLPELRAAIFHFFVYASGAVASVYFGIWLSDLGLNSDQIGVINAMPVLAMLALNLFVGRIADKASDWRQALIVLSLVAGIVPVLLFFVHDFWGILIVWTLLTVPGGSIPPIIDAATLRMTQRNGTDFGAVRAWGTVGYTFFAIVAGVVVAQLGAAAFLPMLLVVSLVRAGMSLLLPRFRTPAQVPTLAEAAPRAGRMRDILKPWFVLPLLAFGLLQSNHALIGAFLPILWKGQGISEALIGPLIAVSAAAEAMMMFFWRRIGGRISARHMILLAAGVSVVRWLIIASSPPVEVLFLAQCLHCITYAVGYFGMVHFIANWTGEEIAAQTQGFAFVLQQAVTVVVLVAFGGLVGQFGIQAFFGAAGISAVSCVCVIVSLALKSPKGERRP